MSAAPELAVVPDTKPAPGFALIVSAPSGAGKTSLVRELRRRIPDLELSVSLTTRAPREGEEDGVHYHFVTVEEFEAAMRGGEMLEHATVFGNLYGTSRAFVASRLSEGADIILEIDWQGAQLARQRLKQTVSVMILPPSLDALEQRLLNRGKDSDEVIATRLAEARDELGHLDEFEYCIINDDFQAAAARLESIVVAERQRTARHRVREAELMARLGPG
ncbi:MAG: guanylate kinase [Pseudomonadota bacterium]